MPDQAMCFEEISVIPAILASELTNTPAFIADEEVVPAVAADEVVAVVC